MESNALEQATRCLAGALMAQARMLGVSGMTASGGQVMSTDTRDLYHSRCD